MRATSQVIMGSTLVMVGSIAIVLALILVLLAELYCSLLLRRCRRLRPPKPIAAALPASTAIVKLKIGDSKTLGVLDAPRNLLLPSLTPMQKEILAITLSQEQNPTMPPPPRQLGLLPAPPSPDLTPLSYSMDEHLVYISNPIFDDGTEKPLRTPFETPDTSPSRMESAGGSSSSDDGEIEVIQTQQASSPSAKQSPLLVTPPLCSMGKLGFQLQLQPSSVSLYTSGSGYTNSKDGVFSSSPGTTPCTSPSW